MQPIEKAEMAAAQVEAPTVDAPGVRLPAEALIPPNLLDGGECVILATKPSLWFVPIQSLRWLAIVALLLALAYSDSIAGYRGTIVNAALLIGGMRLAWALADWVSRCYVLTNRRIMTIRGFLHVDVFECPLSRIQNTELSLTLTERYTRTGSIVMSTAATGGQTWWRTVARPLQIHEQVRSAIARSRGRGVGGD